MANIQEILQSKGEEVFTVAPEASVYDALVLMAQKSVGALVVLEAGEVAGIFSERDYARKVILRGQSSKELQVKTIMTRKVVCVEPDNSVDECLSLMTDKRIRHLPVYEGERLAGVVSIGDLVKAKIADQKNLIAHLEGYIRGG